MKKFTAVLLALCLLLCLCAGCARRSSSDGPSRESSSSSQREKPESSRSDLPSSAPVTSSPEEGPEPEGSPAPEDPGEEPPASESPAPDASVSQPSPSGSGTLQPPAVPHGAELAELDFSVMDKEELTALLQPVLNRARYFCRFALMGDMENIQVDYDPDAAIKRPFRNDEEYLFYPFLNLPYGTVEELKEATCTVFTPDNLEGESVLARYVFRYLTDHDGRLYFASGDHINGAERRWVLDGLEIVSAEKSRLTITAPVSWGPSEESFTAPLNFEVRDGYIVMDGSYFASNAS